MIINLVDNNTGLFTNTPVAVNTVNSGVPSGFNSDADCEGIDPNWESYNIFLIDNDYAEPYQGPNPVICPEGTVQGLIDLLFHCKLLMTGWYVEKHIT